MKIYAIRHGETDWNKEKRIQGRTDIELNEIGIKQAESIKDLIKNEHFDLIISSPLKRAKKTAEIVSNGVPIVYSDGLIERNFGLFEGKIMTEINFEDCYNYNLNYDDGSIEKVQDLVKRVYTFLDEVKEKYSDKKVLLVTHGGVIRAIKIYFEGMPENGMLPHAATKNCELKEFIYKD